MTDQADNPFTNGTGLNTMYERGAIRTIGQLTEQMRAIGHILSDEKVTALLGSAALAGELEMDPVEWLMTDAGHTWQRMSFSSAYSNYLYDFRDDETEDETRGAQWRCQPLAAFEPDEWAFLVSHFHLSEDELAERKDPTRC